MRPAGGSLIAEIFDVETRGKANGIFNWGVYFGIGLTFTLGNYVFLSGTKIKRSSIPLGF